MRRDRDAVTRFSLKSINNYASSFINPISNLTIAFFRGFHSLVTVLVSWVVCMGLFLLVGVDERVRG